MRRFLTLICLLALAIPVGISFSGCTHDTGANYCNGLGYGAKTSDVYSILLQPTTTSLSLAFGQTQSVMPPAAKNCKSQGAATVGNFAWGSSQPQWLDISPTGTLCAGTWNRNSGGGIANYSICTSPNPIPMTGGLPYAVAYITASMNSVVSNPVTVYVHAPVTSVSLVGPTQLSAASNATSCISQGQTGQLDAEACYAGSNNQQFELCAPATVSGANPPKYACASGLQPGVSTVPNCTNALGTLNFTVGSTSVASINSQNNQITAEMPGTSAITAVIAGTGASAGYFTTCPPKSISFTLPNGTTTGVVTNGTQESLVTTILDTNNNPITGLYLDYQSTDPIDISVDGAGGVSTKYPGTASLFAICQPGTCNPSPINEIGFGGAGLSLSSNPVTINTPGTATDYVWFAAPGQSQYVVPINLLTGNSNSGVRLPYVPNSAVMDKSGQNIYFGSSHELIIYTTNSDSVTKTDANVPGLVLAISPNNQGLLINDPVRQIFYVYSTTSGVVGTYSGVGTAAQWTPDSKTLYTVGSDVAGNPTLFVYNANTAWTTYPLPSAAPSLAVTIPSVGAYIGGTSTVAHTWCPSGTPGDYNSMIFYPLGDTVLDASNNPVRTDLLAATTDGNHILGASFVGGKVSLADIGVIIPSTTDANGIKTPIACPSTQVTPTTVTLDPLLLTHTLTQAQFPGLSASAVATINQLVASPASNLAFLTYSAPATATNAATLPYYIPGSTGTSFGSVALTTVTGNSAPTAPVAGAFTPDDKTFFVSTSGDNLVHYVDVPSKTDKQQIAPNLPACGGLDQGCTFNGTGTIVPATFIVVKPRTTT